MKLSQAHIDDLEIEYISKMLKSQKYFGMGQEVQQFEKELKDYIGSEYLPVTCSTGTSALHLAAQSIGLGVGDEVLVPSITYVASFQSIKATGANPVACDINIENGLIDLTDAKSRITKNTKAIMFVHYASYFDNILEVYDFAKKYNLRVIEDAAHSFGNLYQGKKIGSFGDVICFSFDGIKNITCGEGGAIFSTDQKVLNKAKDLRLLGVEKDSDKRYEGKRSWEFDVKEQGWRYHLNNVSAAIGRAQLSKFDSVLAPKRKKIFNLYQTLLKDIPQINLFKSKDVKTESDIVNHILVVRVIDGSRDRLRNILLENSIECGVHYYPNHLLTYFKTSYSLKNAEQFFREELTLPLHPNLEEDDIVKVTNLIKKFYKEF